MTIRELNHLINEYGKDILSFCVYVTGNQADGEDLYQEVFLTAMTKLSAINGKENPKSYLLGIAVKLYQSGRRKKIRRQIIVPITDSYEYLDSTVVPVETEESVEETVLMSEEKRVVALAVRELPEKYRAVILLYYMENLELSEIGEILHIPKGTVASRLHKAKALLKSRLEAYYA